MRISDWSSDVCSSDLQEAAQAKLEAEIAAITALLEPAEADMWPPVVDAVTVTPGYEAALGAALGDDLTVPADEARSEEHTSELQSLMRISYAVFCLKTKNTTN